jgi:predicted nucleotidyltransferase
MDQELLTRLADFFIAHGKGIACVYVFGSRARGYFDTKSDLDIAVLFEQTPSETLDGLGLELAAELEEEVKLPVDLVVLNRASPDLVHRILRDGVLAYEANRPARVRFEVRARAEYFDVLPYLREYRRHRAGPNRDRS